MPFEPTEPEIDVLVAEMKRIYGDATKSQSWFLPFETASETIAWLRTVPTGTGDAGMRAALEKHIGRPLPGDTSGAIAPGA